MDDDIRIREEEERRRRRAEAFTPDTMRLLWMFR